MLGPSLRMRKKLEYPPWDLNMHGRVNIIFAYTVIQKSFIFLL